MSLTPEQRSVLTASECHAHDNESSIFERGLLDAAIESIATARLEAAAERFECEKLIEVLHSIIRRSSAEGDKLPDDSTAEQYAYRQAWLDAAGMAYEPIAERVRSAPEGATSVTDLQTIQDEIAGMMGGWKKTWPGNPNGFCWEHSRSPGGCQPHPVPSTLDGIAALWPKGWQWQRLGEWTAWNPKYARIANIPDTGDELADRTHLLHAVLKAERDAK